MMITLDAYLMGRDKLFPRAYTPEIEAQARRTVELANRLLQQAFYAGVGMQPSPKTGTLITSGWRPPEVNASIPNAAPKSHHMAGRAVDLYDPDGELDDWLMTGPGLAELERVGLWMEHPSATKGWCHLQTVAPRSGRRVFYP